MKLRAVEIACIAFFVGTWLGLKVPFHWLLAAFSGTLLIAAAVLARKLLFRPATVLSAAAFFFIGGFLIKPYQGPLPNHPEIWKVLNKKIDVCGRAAWVERTTSGSEIILDRMETKLDGEALRLRGEMMIRTKQPTEGLGGGEYVCFANLTPRQPNTHRNPGGFDYQYYLKLQGIESVASTKVAKYEIGKRLRDPKSLVLRGRAKIRKAIDENFTNPYRAQLKALILGERRELPEELLEAYRRSGVAHLFAISGFHVGVIAGVAYLLAWWILRGIARPHRYIDSTKFVGAVAMSAVVVYTLIAGARTPSIRAAVMIGLVYLALARKRPPKLRAVVFSAALLVGLLRPASVLTASYQLSFSAAIALIVLFPRFHRFLDERNHVKSLLHPTRTKIIRGLLEAFFVSLSASLGTLPFIIFHFHRVSLIAPFTNMLIIPLAALALPLIALGTSLLLLWQGFGVALLQVIRPSLLLMNKLAVAFAKIPYASVWAGSIDWWEILLYGLGFTAILASTKRLRLLAIPLFGAIVFWEVWLSSIAPALKDDLTATFIDVGQGDSALIEAPNSTRILIDGGGVQKGHFDFGKKVVAPVLWKKRIRSLDLLILTHPHPDHFDGLRFIAKHFDIDEFWHPDLYSSDPRYRELLGIIRERRIPTKIVDASIARRAMNGLLIEVLNPPPEVRDTNHELSMLSMNDKSLAMMMRWGRLSLLHMGDATIEAQKLMLSAGREVTSDLMKVAHHGAKDAVWSSFLDEAAPDVAVISVGARNPYGSPHDETLGLLNRKGIATFRTDEDGAVIARATAHRLTVCGWASKRCADVELLKGYNE